ncbi:hypothetical protein H671_1g1253 [Cricetulus griseus]|nr:hypothetical protein H671_1g1253 [Cricetulus griseus]
MGTVAGETTGSSAVSVPGLCGIERIGRRHKKPRAAWEPSPAAPAGIRGGRQVKVPFLATESDRLATLLACSVVYRMPTSSLDRCYLVGLSLWKPTMENCKRRLLASVTLDCDCLHLHPQPHSS